MARYAFYEIRSARNDDAESDDTGTRLHRRSFACAERDDLTLFAWLGPGEELEMFQLLFRERFVTWSKRRGLEVGVTSRYGSSPYGEVRQQGVRSLHGAARGESDGIIKAARDLIASAELPPDVDGPIRSVLG